MPVSTPNGYLDFTNATPRATKVIATSNVGIGTSAPGFSLDVHGDSNTGAVTSTTINVTDTTASTSKTSGSLTVAGGLGVSGNIYADLPVATIASNLVTYDKTTGLLKDSGGLFSNKLAVVSEQPPAALTSASTTITDHGVYKVTASVGSATAPNVFNKTGTSWTGSADYTGTNSVYAGSTRLASSTPQGDWIVLELPYKATLRHLTVTDGPLKANLFATNDNITWTELTNWSSVSGTVIVNATATYKKYAVVATQLSSGATLTFGELRLFTESFAIDGGKVAMASSAITGGNTVVDQTGPHARDVVPLRKYPEVNMQDYRQGGYTASASSDQNIDRVAAGYAPLVERSAWAAFNGSETDGFWQAYYPAAPYDGTEPYDANTNSPTITDVDNVEHRGHWIKLELPHKIKVQKMTTNHGDQPERYDSVILLGSNDDTNWYVIKDTFTLPVTSFTSTEINSNIAYKYVLLLIKSLGTSDNNVDLYQLQYYGYEEVGAGDDSVDVTFKSVYNSPDLTNAALYIDGLKGSAATDHSGASVAVTENNVTWDSAEKAWTLTGANSNIVSGNLVSLVGDHPHSISAWVKADQLNGSGLFHVGTAEGEGDAASRVGFVDSHISWGGEDHYFSNAEWHNVTYTYNGEGSDKKLFLDGRRVATAKNEDSHGEFPPFAMSTYSQGGYVVSTGDPEHDGGQYIWKAFDGDVSTFWFSHPGSADADSTYLNGDPRGNAGQSITDSNGTTHTGSWGKIEFPHKFVLNYLEVQGGTPASAYYPHNPNNYVILGSNDDEVWDLLSTRTGASPTSDGMTTGGTQIDRHTVNAQKAYKYIIFLVTQINTLGGGREFIIAALRLYGHRENDLVRFPDSVNTLKYPHVAMTGPAQRGYVATASSYRTVGPGDYRPHKAFNKVFNAGSNQGWNNQNTLTEYNGTDYLYNGSINLGTGAQNGEWIKLELPRKILMTSMTLYSRDNDPTRAPEDFIVYGSNDDSNWSELLSEVGATPADTGTTYTADTATTYYKYFALVVRRITGQNNYFSIDNIEYIGTEEDLDVVARVGDGYDGKVRNLRVYSTALSDARVQEIFDADKDELGLAKSSVSVYRGHLGVGTTEPKAALTVMDEVGELIQLPPGNMTAHDQYFEKHGVFKARTSPGHDTGNYPPWEGFNDTIGTLWYTGYSDSSASYNGTSGAYSGTAQLGSTTKLGEYLVLEMPYKVFPKRMEYIRQSSGSHLITNAYVYGRNGSNGIWTEIGSFTDGGPPDDWVPKVVHLNNSEPYDQLAFVPTKRYAASTSAGVSCHLVRYFGTREQGASTLHNGELSLTRNLTVPRIGPPLDADDTPRRDRLVVEYNTSTNPTANGVVKDTSGRGLDGLLDNTYGGAAYNPYYDASEKALVFDGSNDYVFQNDVHLKTGVGGVYSASVWVRNRASSGTHTVYSLGTYAQLTTSTLYVLDTTLQVVFYNSDLNVTYTIPKSTWTNIVVTHAGGPTSTTTKMYINGVDVGLAAASGTSYPLSTVNFPSPCNLFLGKNSDNSVYGGPMDLSNFKLYDVALTADEAKRLYDMGRCDEGHHVVNFSKTRVGIGLGDGEAPRAALDVRDLCEIKQLGVGMIGTGIHRPSIAPLSVCKDTFDELGGGIELMRTNTPEGNSGLGFNRGSAIWHAYKSSTNRETLYFAIGGGNYGTSSYDYNRVRGYIDTNNGGGNITFTGQHRAVVEGTPLHETEKYQGLIVSAKNNKYVKLNNGIETGSSAITINESVPLVSLSSVAQDKSCFGVISDSEDPDVREDRIGNFVTTGQKEKGDHRWFINSVGEGAIWVADMNGPLESGDYITTSNIAGYGQKQDGAGLMNYTAAKITMDCDFEPATQPIQCIKQSNVVETHYTGLVPVVKGVPHEFVTTTVTADDEWSNVSVSPSDVTYTEWSNLEANVQNTYTLTYTQTSNVVYDVKYTKTTTANVTAEDAWDAVHIEPPSVTYAEYSNLEANVQNTYSLTYTMTTKVEATEAIYSNLSTEDKEFFVPTYYQLVEQTVDAEYPGAVKHETVTDRLENALDEHGQLQWEDDPSGVTEKAYKIRYLDATGQQTDEANCVHRAAFVGCTYHCG